MARTSVLSCHPMVGVGLQCLGWSLSSIFNCLQADVWMLYRLHEFAWLQCWLGVPLPWPIQRRFPGHRTLWMFVGPLMSPAFHCDRYAFKYSSGILQVSLATGLCGIWKVSVVMAWTAASQPAVWPAHTCRGLSPATCAGGVFSVIN